MSASKLAGKIAILLLLVMLVVGCAPVAAPAPTAAPSKPAAPAASPTAAAAKPAAKGQLTKIVALYPQRAPVGDWAHLWVSKELGYFADEGLDVDVQMTGGSTDSVRLLSVGQGDISLASADAVILGRSQNMKVRIVYTHQYGTIFGVAVPEDGPVKTPKDLAGKTIGVQTFGSAAMSIAKAIMKENGADPNSATFVEIGLGAQAATAIKGGRVQASAAFDTQFFQYEQILGAKLRRFQPAKADQFVSSTINVRDDDITARPKIIEGFIRAFTKGVIFGLENPDAAVQLMGRSVPEVLKDKALTVGTYKVRQERFALPREANGVWGWNDASRLQVFTDFLYDTEQIKEKPKAADLWDARFLAPGGQFDAQKVREQARNWKP